MPAEPHDPKWITEPHQPTCSAARQNGAVTTRVFLLDDHEVVRRGLRDLLEAEDDLEVVGEAGTAEEAYGRIPATSPERGRARRPAPRRRRGRGLPGDPLAAPRHRLLDADLVRRRRGPASPPSWPAPLATSSSRYAAPTSSTPSAGSAAGESLLDPAVTTRVLERIRHSDDEDELAGLTEQERKILELIADGLTNRQIGEQMFLAEKTVKNYVSNLLSKLGMSRRTEAAAYAARLAERQHPDHHL